MTQTAQNQDLVHRLLNIRPGERIEFWRGTTFQAKDAPVIEAATAAYELGAATIERQGDAFIAEGRTKPYFPEEGDAPPPLPELKS